MEKKAKHLLIAIATLGVLSCNTARAARARDSIQQGMLTLGLSEQAFLEVWGKPERTSTITGEEVSKGRIGGVGSVVSGSYFQGKETYEVWTYETKEVVLIFDRKRKLMGWTTDKTVKELASPDG